jgi:hypothetical protein
MKKKSAIFFIPLLLSLLHAQTALAVCPVCAVAVGAGLGLSRWLGIDDSVSGLWIGALIVIFIVWTITWMDKKNLRFRFRNAAVIAGWYLLVIVPFYYAKIITHPVDFLCSCAKDKLILGIASGGSAFYFGSVLYDYLKEKNNGHAHFPFEKVVMPVFPLIVLTILFYFLTK